MRTLGVYTGPHDPGACLVRDGETVAMIEEERLTRVKYGVVSSLNGLWSDFSGRFGYFPWASVAYCLDKEGVGLDDLDAIVLPDENLSPLAALSLPVRDESRVLVARQPEGGAHHYIHALSAFYASPFAHAAVLVIDGDGTWTPEGYEAESGYLFARESIHSTVFKNRYRPLAVSKGTGPVFYPGIGWMYEYVSKLLGFFNTRAAVPDAGKTMGLSAYGSSTRAVGEAWIEMDGHALNFDPFLGWLRDSGYGAFLERPEVSLVFDEDNIGSLARDLAWKAQQELQRAVVALAKWLRSATGEENLCIAGGVGLNSVANEQICRCSGFKNVFIQPASGDNGQAIGLAYEGHISLGGRQQLKGIRHAFGGMSYLENDVTRYLDLVGASYDRIPPDDLAEDAAKELSNGNIIGWFQHGSEFGPRALGHRSVLADPRGPEMKDEINRTVKFREAFRPFAPAVLDGWETEVFDLEPGADVRFMLRCAPVRDGWQPRIPAVCHVDQTARLQVVRRDVDDQFWSLIEAFRVATGVPVVVNTSMNLRGEPLVETPADAFQFLASTDLRALYIGRIKVHPPTADRIYAKLLPGWSVHGSSRPNGWSLVSPDGSAKSELDELGARTLLAVRDDRTVVDAAIVGDPSIQPLSSETYATLLDLVRRCLRVGALSARIGSLPLQTKWTFGRLPESDGARRAGVDPHQIAAVQIALRQS